MSAPPYYAQWESPGLVAAILAGACGASEDPLWRASGAASPEEYEYWSWRTCGIACLRMILAGRGIMPPPAVHLAKEVLGAGGYVRRPDGGLDGLIYQPFVDYLASTWSITAVVAAPLPVHEIRTALDDGMLAIASVSPAIRRPDGPPPARGGHLVLVHGHRADALLIHNPSGHTPATQAGACVALERFDACYAGRGILVAGAPGPRRACRWAGL